MKIEFEEQGKLFERFETLCSPVVMNEAARNQLEFEKQKMFYEALLEIRDLLIYIFQEIKNEKKNVS